MKNSTFTLFLMGILPLNRACLERLYVEKSKVENEHIDSFNFSMIITDFYCRRATKSMLACNYFSHNHVVKATCCFNKDAQNVMLAAMIEGF